MTTKTITSNEHYQNDNNLLSNSENYQNDNAKKSLESKRRKNLTKEQIIQAIKSLEANNEEITIVKIYDKLQNRGSYRTIIKVKKEYEQEKIERELELKRNDIKREEITQVVTHIVEDAYLANIEYVRIQLAKAQETASNSTQAASTSTSSSSSAQSSSLVLKSVEPKAQQEYDAAYAKVVNNDLSGASSAFTNYLQNYPDNTLTPNAWYWLAQVQYKQKKLDEARVSFLNVARFTSSTKRPDALYKLGLISKMRGDKDKAQAYFNLVIRTYPADTSSNLARKELASLQAF